MAAAADDVRCCWPEVIVSARFRQPFRRAPPPEEAAVVLLLLFLLARLARFRVAAAAAALLSPAGDVTVIRWSRDER